MIRIATRRPSGASTAWFFASHNEQFSSSNWELLFKYLDELLSSGAAAEVSLADGVEALRAMRVVVSLRETRALVEIVEAFDENDVGRYPNIERLRKNLARLNHDVEVQYYWQ